MINNLISGSLAIMFWWLISNMSSKFHEILQIIKKNVVSCQLGANKNYLKVPRFLEASNLFCNLPKNQTKSPNLTVFCRNDADEIANSEDLDQTAPRGAVWIISVMVSPPAYKKSWEYFCSHYFHRNLNIDCILLLLSVHTKQASCCCWKKKMSCHWTKKTSLWLISQ